MNIHFPSEKLILLDFSSPRGVTTLGCEFHSQAGLATPPPLRKFIHFWKDRLPKKCVHQTSHTHLRGFVWKPFVTRGREGTFFIIMYRTLHVHICKPNITPSKNKWGFVCGPFGLRGGKGTFSVLLRGGDLWVWVFGGYPEVPKIVHVWWSFVIFARAWW